MRKIVSLLVCLVLAACVQAPKSDKEFDLVQVSYSSIKGWSNDDFNEVYPALKQACAKPKAEWKTFCDGLANMDNASSKVIRRYIEKMLVPYQVYSYGSANGTFTGYYESALQGSLKQTPKFNTPIYGVPNDLIVVDLASFGISSDKKQLVGRAEKGKLAPYYKRSELEGITLDAPVLLYVDDPVEVFILHIQGSGRVETDEGVVRVGYAGNNGHAFVGIGGLMKEEGVLENGKTSMPHIREWLKNNPQKAQDIMRMNPRYIFFRVLDGDISGPLGAAGVPLTAERSMAVDANFIPMNTPMFLNTTDAYGKKINKLVMAQDVGSAIKGPVRGDYFWGYGEKAFQEAGRMKSNGSYIMLWPRGAVPPTK